MIKMINKFICFKDRRSSDLATGLNSIVFSSKKLHSSMPQTKYHYYTII